MEQTITLSPRGEERIQNGHFWVYRGDVAGGRAEPGAVVRVAAFWLALFTAIDPRLRCGF
jgi:PUA-like domain